MRIIITGGTGLIGKPLSKALVADGHEVIVLTRAPEKVKDAPAGVKLQKWDGKSADDWGELADGAGAIINLAGAGIADKRWSQERKREIRQSRIDAGKAVMAAITAASKKPGVLIQSSAVGYYGAQTGDAQVTESFSPGGDFLSKVCFDWEASTAPAGKQGVRRVVIRTGVVLSNEGGAFPKQVLPFKLF
ncbi:MAG: NAD-dependent epimerase/dehydratase family protein, partial [Caldilinea sp.]